MTSSKAPPATRRHLLCRSYASMLAPSYTHIETEDKVLYIFIETFVHMRKSTTVSGGKLEDQNQHPIHILSEASKLVEEAHKKILVAIKQDPQQQLYSAMCKESESLTNSNISTNAAVGSAKGTRNLLSNDRNNNSKDYLNVFIQKITQNISPCMIKSTPACTFQNNGMDYYKVFYHESPSYIPMNQLYFNRPVNILPYSS